MSRDITDPDDLVEGIVDALLTGQSDVAADLARELLVLSGRLSPARQAMASGESVGSGS